MKFVSKIFKLISKYVFDRIFLSLCSEIHDLFR